MWSIRHGCRICRPSAVLHPDSEEWNGTGILWRFGFQRTHEAANGVVDWTLNALSYEDRHVLIRPVSDKVTNTTI